MNTREGEKIINVPSGRIGLAVPHIVLGRQGYRVVFGEWGGGVHFVALKISQGSVNMGAECYSMISYSAKDFSVAATGEREAFASLL